MVREVEGARLERLITRAWATEARKYLKIGRDWLEDTGGGTVKTGRMEIDSRYRSYCDIQMKHDTGFDFNVGFWKRTRTQLLRETKDSTSSAP